MLFGNLRWTKLDRVKNKFYKDGLLIKTDFSVWVLEPSEVEK